MSLLLAHTRLWRNTAGMRVNPRNHFARGLWAALVPVGNTFLNLAPGTPPWQRGNMNLTYGHHPQYGQWLRKPSGSGSAAYTLGPYRTPTSSDSAGFFLVSEFSNTANTGIATSQLGSSYGFGINSSGVMSLYLASAQRVTGATTLPNFSTEINALAYTTFDDNPYFIYLEGVQDGSASGTAFNSMSGIAALQSYGTYSGGIRHHLALSWRGRALSDDEHRLLARDPWQLFDRPIWWFGASAGGGDVSVALTGTTATSTQGALTPAIGKALTGQAATTAQGTLTRTAENSVAIVGLALTTAQGALVAAIEKALTGQAATTAQGTLSTVTGTSVALTGLGATTAQGALIAAIAKALTGQTVTTAQGLIVPATAKALTGQAATLAGGTLGTDTGTVVALAGLAASVSGGILTPALAKALSGAGLVLQNGSLSASSGPTLTGRSATASAGTLGTQIGATLPGLMAVTAGGVLVPLVGGDITLALAGLRITATGGVLRFPTLGGTPYDLFIVTVPTMLYAQQQRIELVSVRENNNVFVTL